ncbi:flagellar motor protein MotD [Luteimonas sp. R10]|uniref:flagellar motor protein MotD n=1 Tax=Luteimonas sp. R10 TaxID=3108176 RepID=UPI00308F0EAE|nr:flagellar motor protein MotD [Luteimonas sp. R10]
MARRKRHDEHNNHEAWAIPYADLMTLLLAFFVVMYAVSSLNEGKYRVLSDSLAIAFSGQPRSLSPLEAGDHQVTDPGPPASWKSGSSGATPSPVLDSPLMPSLVSQMRLDRENRDAGGRAPARARRQLDAIAAQLRDALAPMIEARLITIHRAELWLEVEINSDILFATGSASLAGSAQELLADLALLLRDTPNAVRVEGYTDDRPINTLQFPSNWELSAARAASVVHLFVRERIAPQRLVMVGYGEHRPRADNATEEGRNRNRRVVLMVLAAPEADGDDIVPDPGGPADTVASGRTSADIAAGTSTPTGAG